MIATEGSADRPVAVGPAGGAAAAFFEHALAGFAQAAHRGGGPLHVCYRIGPQVVRFSFASRALIPFITPAIEHLRIEPVDDPTFTVCLWDSQSSNVAMPAPTWSWDSITVRGEVQPPAGESLLVSIQPEFCGLSLLAPARATGLYWVRDPRLVPSHERAEPLLRMFHWACRLDGSAVVHGGAVGTVAGGVLLAGPGGAGKSNTALSCAMAGMSYAGDDYCVVSLDGRPTVFSLYGTAKLHSADVEQFPMLAPAIVNPNRPAEEKAVYVLNDTRVPVRLVRDLPLSAICVLRVTGSTETSVEPAPKSAAFLAIAPNTMCQLPNAGSDTVAAVSQLVRRVPCYYLNVGRDHRRLAAAIDTILARVAEASRGRG